MLGGLLVGGLIGGLLFGGLGAGFGVGLMDILLLGGIAFLIIAFLRRRRAPEAAPAYSMAGGGSMGAPAPASSERGGSWSAATAVAEAPASTGNAELERGLAHIRSMDPRFDAATLAAEARGTFRDVQAAVTARDAAPLRSRLTPEMANVLQSQCDRLRSARQTNRMERIDVRHAEITEAWQEGGQDFVTVYLEAALLDYTVDDRTGSVLDGSSTVPQEIEEYWTFTRPVGPNPWRLSAIQTR
jgi:predicted lipid-binding transport protein (Tim44 family)